MFFQHNPIQIWSSSMEIFTSDAIQGNESDMWWFVLNFKERVKNGPKNWFCWSFLEVFLYALLRPMSYVPLFGQTKGLIEIHKRGSFHQYTICRWEVIHLQRFFVAAESWIFGCFRVVFQRLLPQIKSDLYKNFTRDAVQGNASHILRFFTKS